jgi:hypothetical protein
MVVCAVALKRYTLKHGKPPPDLDSLVPDFVSSVPIDFMDGKPMKYQLQPDGRFVLYSVGKDCRDDGGDPTSKTSKTYFHDIWTGRDAVWPSPASDEEVKAYESKVW